MNHTGSSLFKTIYAAMKNPFADTNYDQSEDLQLIREALEGSGTALEHLIKKHQHYIYNVALKMVLSPIDAEDITQEVLIKVVTKLAQFQGKSNFRTWLYRITFNHFLKMKKSKLEAHMTTLESYGDDLDEIEDVAMTEQEKIEQRELIKETKFSCMMGMLLCLSRPQRLVFILGEVFEADHNIGSELLGITKANFRKRLERARRDLYQFMNNKCGLINKANSCRCAKKTSGFIKKGWVNKENLMFNTAYFHTIKATIPNKNQQLNELIDEDYASLFQDTPFQEKEHHRRLVEAVFKSNKMRETFNLR